MEAKIDEINEHRLPPPGSLPQNSSESLPTGMENEANNTAPSSFEEIKNIQEHKPPISSAKGQNNEEQKSLLSSGESPKIIEKPVFKVPILIGPRPQKLKHLKKNTPEHDSLITSSFDKAVDSNVKVTGQLKHSATEKVQSEATISNAGKSPAEALQDTSIAIPYKEPPWSGLPSKSYNFEVLKGGIILDTINLSTRPFTVFGRLACCDITMDHPSISRFHAIVQYRLSADDGNPSGFYLYDLESTHGTTLNKCPVKPRCYYRLHVGHMVKFGGSSRMYILQGPEEDAEEESPLTVTEIKEKARQDEEIRRQEKERLQKLKEEADAKKEKEDEDMGIDWGMGDDAAEEDAYGDNPYALDAPILNEELYINDPKKTLRGWFEREGYDLEYNVEEKGQAHFLCRVQLPLDTPSGGSVYAEASVKGKKKEAVIACALEACRILDRHGVLRQANHEGRHRKSKKWEDEDYYDSDEDTYLDQTGTIEKKRMQRIQRAGKDGGGIETFESLTQKHNQILKEIEETEAALTKSVKQDLMEEQKDIDPLDAYMMAIKSSKDSLDKRAKTGLKIHLARLKQEEQKLRKLVNIARPASLPVYPKHSPSLKITSPTHKPVVLSPKEPETPNLMQTKAERMVMPMPNPEAVAKTNLDTNTNQASSTDDSEVNAIVETSRVDEISIQTIPVSVSQEKIIEDERKEDLNIKNDDSNLLKVEPKRKNAHDAKRNKRSKQKLKYDYDSSDPNYAMWLPPDNQSGDGRTNLNEKYGY